MSYLLRESLLDPTGVSALSMGNLALLVAQARNSRLLASLEGELQCAGVLAQLPETAQRHFEAARLTHEKQRRDLTYDVDLVRRALATRGVPLVLLKGGAYIAADLPVSRGRLITDIDILVPRTDLSAAEETLHEHHWESPQISAYDESYYRRWSHEIPALHNSRRDTTLDVHHNILPPTAGPNIDAALLLEDKLEISPGVYTLSYRDMVIHSATHLFQEGEFHHGLRDVWDLDRMLRDFPGRDAAFWDELVERARRLQLETPLYHGLNYAQQVFGTPIPPAVMARAESPLRRLRKPLMDFLYLRAFRPNHPATRLPLTGLALYLLYVRSHYLRMPPHLLLPHLARKAWMRHKDSAEQAAN
ncbi:MAG: nucleotidyltransferase family protein [Halioglobus sp.]|nr:nucleotidyltransferase family protein [Halioglobus sp.]